EDVMRQIFLALWLSINICVVCAQPLPQAAPPPTKQCGPSIVGVLIKIGWAYATKTSLSFDQPRPCPDSTQEPQRKVRPRPTPEPKPDAPSAVARLDNGLAELPATEVMRLARLLYIRPRSAWFNSEKLERELLKRKEFGELGLEITRKAS